MTHMYVPPSYQYWLTKVNQIWQFVIEITSALWKSHAIWDHIAYGISPGSGTFPPEAGTGFSDDRGMQG